MADKGLPKLPAEVWPVGRGTTKTVALPQNVKGQSKTGMGNPYGTTSKKSPKSKY